MIGAIAIMFNVEVKLVYKAPITFGIVSRLIYIILLKLSINLR